MIRRLALPWLAAALALLVAALPSIFTGADPLLTYVFLYGQDLPILLAITGACAALLVSPALRRGMRKALGFAARLRPPWRAELRMSPATAVLTPF